MKKTFSIIAMIALTIFNSGCNDWLELKPESDLVLEDFWQNEGHVEQVLAACYNSTLAEGVIDRMMVWGEMRSDNIIKGNKDMSETMFDLLNFDITSYNGYCSWGSMYSGINICNTWLHYAPGVMNLDGNYTEVKHNKLKAEVLSIRALLYFYLVRTFKEVPWIVTPSIDDTQDYYYAKSSEEVVLSHIIEDLKWALIYAEEKFDIEINNKGRITKNAIRSLLADISLWNNDYSACVEYCNQVLADQALVLEDGEDVLENVFFTGNSTESIFELQFDHDIKYNNSVAKLYGKADEKTGFWSFPSVLYLGDASPFSFTTNGGLEGEKDLRVRNSFNYSVLNDSYDIVKYAAFAQITDLGSDVYFYNYYYRNENSTANWIVYRLSDIMLMKAEALVEMESNPDEVMNLVNTTFLRSNPDLEGVGLNLNDYPTFSDLRTLVLRERQRELLFEGKRWFDLMRLARRQNSTAALFQYVQKKFGDGSSANVSKMSVLDALYLPISENEIKINPNLVQNPFYEGNNDGSISR